MNSINLNQSIKTDLYSAMYRKQIRGAIINLNNFSIISYYIQLYTVNCYWHTKPAILKIYSQLHSAVYLQLQ